jgi:hypothetical protein
MCLRVAGSFPNSEHGPGSVCNDVNQGLAEWNKQMNVLTNQTVANRGCEFRHWSRDGHSFCARACKCPESGGWRPLLSSESLEVRLSIFNEVRLTSSFLIFAKRHGG